MNKGRIQWIDHVKGFAIICMVISHSIAGYDNPLKNWITAFNMPLFFFVSGLLAKEYEQSDLSGYLKKKILTVGIPYFVFCTLYLIFMAGLSLISGTEMSQILSEFIAGIKDMVFMNGVQSMWYLPVYFFSSLIFDFIVNRKRIRTFQPVIACVLIIVLLLMNRFMVLNSPLRLAGKVMAAIVFMISANLLKPFIGKIKLFPALLVLLCISVTAVLNGFVSVNFEYGHYTVLFFADAIVMSFLICALFCSLKNSLPIRLNRLLCYFGKNTIVILVSNNLIIEILRLLDYKLSGNFFLSSGTAGCLVFAVIILCLEALIIRLARGKAGILFGRFARM